MKRMRFFFSLQGGRFWQKSAKPLLMDILKHIKTVADFGAKMTPCLLLIGCEEPKQPLPLPKADILVEPKLTTRLDRALYSAHLQLDPQFVKAVADAAPVRDLLVGLMMFNAQGEVVPAMGKQFMSEDGKTWLISLDEKAMWSNGEPVTAYDFSESWRRLASPSNNSPLADYLIYMGVENAREVISGDVDLDSLGIEANGKHLLQIRLSKPNFQFPKMLAHIALLPTYQGKKPQAEETLVSNGAYRVKSINKMLLELQAVDPKLAFQAVRYQLIGTVQNPDRFDIIENPLQDYKRNEIALPRLCTYFYDFNFENKFLAQKEVRQAIRSMISPTEISRDWGIPNQLALPKVMVPEHTRHISQQSPEQLLHPLGVDSAHPIRINLTYDNDETKHSNIAHRIARTLGQSDLFRVMLQPVDWKLLMTKRNEKNFQLIRSGWCSDYDDPLVFLMPFHSQSPDNKSGYANLQVDKQLERLVKIRDENERKQVIYDIVRELENDVAILPLFQYQRRVAVSPEIRGVDLNNTSEVIYSKDLYRQ